MRKSARGYNCHLRNLPYGVSERPYFMGIYYKHLVLFISDRHQALPLISVMNVKSAFLFVKLEAHEFTQLLEMGR